MLRRRRRSAGTWLPTIGSIITGDQILPGRNFSLTGGAGLSSNLLVFPVTYDVPQWNDATLTAGKGMGEIVGNEYIIKRIVGKLHVGQIPLINDVLDENNPTTVGAGFFVARAQTDALGNRDQPVGMAAGVAGVSTYSPLDGDTIREPWMWRRTWVFGTALTTAATATATDNGCYLWPPSTAGYNSLHEGGHIDIKSRRRVRLDERLWFAIASTAWVPGTGIAGQQLDGYLDIRIFGQLRKPRNQGAF